MVTSKCYLINSTQTTNYAAAKTACTTSAPTGPATGGYLTAGI
jgi:hypothetical protein